MFQFLAQRMFLWVRKDFRVSGALFSSFYNL